MTTSLGAIVFAAIICGLVALVIWALFAAAKRGERLGKATVTAEEADELLARAAEKQEAERELDAAIAVNPERRAVDRLRHAKGYRGE